MESCISDRRDTTRVRVILLIEDNAEDAFFLCRALDKQFGGSFKVSHSTTIAEAKACLKENLENIDLILLDLGLPDTPSDQNSFEVLKPYASDIPIVILTGVEDHYLALSLIQEGAADFLNKNLSQENPRLLKGVIEFSLARDKISKITARKNATNLVHIGELRTTEIQTMKEQEGATLEESRTTAAAVLKKAIAQGNNDLKKAVEHGEKNLRDAKSDAEALLKDFQDESAGKHREKDQIIHWMSGGYSL